MRDLQFGSSDSRHLQLRLFAPLDFSRWHGHGFRFSVWRLFNPRNWLRAACCRDNWRCGCRVWRDCNDRCYCPVGVSINGAIVLCGFGLMWFYSFYDGEIPCRCDRVLEDISERKLAERN